MIINKAEHEEELVLDVEFREDESRLIQKVLDGVNDLIRLSEQPQAFFSRQALESLIATLPIRASHLINKH